MRHALGLGARELGRCWPNPAVGCVILRDGRVVGRGWTQAGGRPHAETVALAQAGEAARGATAYVTLEPCAHHGGTPPCAEALIAAGVVRVVTALEDPDPRVAGRGHAMLRAAGIEVATGVEAAAAEAAHAGFLHRLRTGRPRVTLKLATTLDGRIATASGESRWITGPAARHAVHALRLSHDAVMVGAGTLRADDPELTVRGFGAVRQPVRIAVDSRAMLPPGARLLREVAAAPVWLCHAEGADPLAVATLRDAGVRMFACRDAEGQVDLPDALAALGKAGLTRILCEGGGALAASLLRQGLVAEVVTSGAGRVIGADGRASVGPLGLATLADAPRLALRELSEVGGDVMARWAVLFD